MKQLYSLFLLLIPFLASASENIVVSGVYQGSDLYVQNPFMSEGVSFCVFEVRVNGDVTSDEVNSSAFVVDLDIMGLKVGDAVEVIISHKPGCQPRILNPEVLKPRSSFKVEEIAVSDGGLLNWSTTGEAGELPFVVEQFRWNKWVRAGEVMGAGKPQLQQYQFQVTPHSGKNVVRIKQTDHRKITVTSEPVEFVTKIPEVTFALDKSRNKITFTHQTQYEIFDEYGNLMKTGFDKEIDVEPLERGSYYLNYDRSFGETFKKR